MHRRHTLSRLALMSALVVPLLLVPVLPGQRAALAQEDPGKSTTKQVEEPAPAPEAEAEAEAPAVAEKELIESIAKQLKSKDETERQAGALAALKLQHKSLFSPLVSLLKDKSPEVRLAAIRALAEREDAKERTGGAKAIAARLPKLSKNIDDEPELLAAIEALDGLAEPATIRALVSDIEPSTRSEVVEARLEAVANIPHAAAIDALIKLASSGRRRGAGGAPGRAVRALRQATGENFGADPDAWRAWWKDAKKTFNFTAKAEERRAERDRQAERERRRAEREAGGEKRREPRRRGGGKRKGDEGEGGEDS